MMIEWSFPFQYYKEMQCAFFQDNWRLENKNMKIILLPFQAHRHFSDTLFFFTENAFDTFDYFRIKQQVITFYKYDH